MYTLLFMTGIWGCNLTAKYDISLIVCSTPCVSVHQDVTCSILLWVLYLKDLSQNWQGYGRPAPPSSSPPVAMPRSQHPSGICEGDATSLLEGEEGTQDSPAGSSSPSDKEGNRQEIYIYIYILKKTNSAAGKQKYIFCTQLRDLHKRRQASTERKKWGKTGSIRMIKKKLHLSWKAEGRRGSLWELKWEKKTI